MGDVAGQLGSLTATIIIVWLILWIGKKIRESQGRTDKIMKEKNLYGKSTDKILKGLKEGSKKK